MPSRSRRWVKRSRVTSVAELRLATSEMNSRLLKLDLTPLELVCPTFSLPWSGRCTNPQLGGLCAHPSTDVQLGPTSDITLMCHRHLSLPQSSSASRLQ